MATETESKLLDDYLSDQGFCDQLGIKLRTSKSYRDNRTGPAPTYIAGKVFYRRETVRAWLLAREGIGRGMPRMTA